MPKKPPLYPHVPKSQMKKAEEEARASVPRMEVKLWTGTRLPVSDREEAVMVIKRELEGWMEKGDKIVWYDTPEDKKLGRKPSFAVVVNEVGEETDASAMILGALPTAPASATGAEVKANYYFCDNTRLHSNNEVIQIKTEEEDPKCPYCGAVMTYGRYWGPLIATQL